MGSTARLSLAATGLLAGAALVWALADTGAPEPKTGAAMSAGGAAADLAAAPELPAPPTERVAAPTAEVVAPDLAHPYEFDLQVEVVDRDGLPVPGAQIHVAPAGCALDKYPQRTGPDGVVHVLFRGKQAAMEVVLAVDSLPSLRRCLVQSGAPRRIVLEGQDQQQHGIVLTWRLSGAQTGAGRLLTENRIGLRVGDGSRDAGQALALSLDFLDKRATFSELTVRTGLHPHACFADALLSKKPGEPAPAETLTETIFFARALEATDLGGLTIVSDRVTWSDSATNGEAPPTTILEGIVYGEDGKPVPKCTVAWGTEVDRPRGRMQTDEHGAFRFDDVPADWLEVRAGGGDGGLRRGRVQTAAGKTTRWEARLERQARIAGKAIDQDGKPLAGFKVEFAGTALPYFDACTVHDDGTFELPNHPGTAGSLLLWHGKAEARLPVLVEPTVLPDSGEVVLRLPKDAAKGQLQIEPILPDGLAGVAGVAGAGIAAEARVWQEDTGRGAPMAKAENGNLYSLANLPAGWYRVEIGATSLGWTDAGRHWIDGKSLVDLGRFPLPRPGKLRIVRDPGAPKAGTGSLPEICVRRPDCDVRAEDAQSLAADELLLPAGDYWFLWRGADAALRHVPFTIRAGGETTVAQH